MNSVTIDNKWVLVYDGLNQRLLCGNCTGETSSLATIELFDTEALALARVSELGLSGPGEI